jgi:hypothetical protein
MPVLVCPIYVYNLRKNLEAYSWQGIHYIPPAPVIPFQSRDSLSELTNTRD